MAKKWHPNNFPTAELVIAVGIVALSLIFG